MKTKGIVGTPINSYGPGGGGVSMNNGFNPSLPPKNMTGTVNNHFQGDQSQQPNPRSGTPASHLHGNPDEARAVRSSGPYGVSPAAGGVDMNNAESMNGVVFDGVSASRDNIPTPGNVMDSPVAAGAQRPDTDSKAKLNALRNGEGEAYSAADTIPDHFNGVMAR